VETIISGSIDRQIPLFNSPLETGIRALVLLDALYPRSCDLTEMTWFDHLVVHTSDLQGFWGQEAPPSLHPDLSGRAGELFVRRRLLEESLHLMQSVHLVEVVHLEEGFYFLASEDAPSFLALLKSPYTTALKERASWLAEHLGHLSFGVIRELIAERVGRWEPEFGPSPASEEGTR
jgi:hypothetical protein